MKENLHEKIEGEVKGFEFANEVSDGGLRAEIE